MIPPFTSIPYLLSIVPLFFLPFTTAQGTSLPNALSYHSDTTSPRSFQGVYGSNFNETITFCNFKEKPWELNSWGVIPVIAQSADSGQSQYNIKGALLYGGAYAAANGSIIWKGLGFSQNGPYDCAFALGPKGKAVSLIQRKIKAGNSHLCKHRSDSKLM